MRQLLHDNKGVFTLEGEPLGRTDLVQHKIVVTAQTPIKQAVQRTPMHLWQEANAEVGKMLSSGVIESSKSTVSCFHHRESLGPVQKF